MDCWRDFPDKCLVKYGWRMETNNKKAGLGIWGGVGFCTARGGESIGNLAHLGDGHDLSLPRTETAVH